jgi:DNA helicase-2/ATP-dependent DNA helicase PcrA
MQKWLADPQTALAAQSRAKLYVAITRARHSVAVAMDWKSAALPAGFVFYEHPQT